MGGVPVMRRPAVVLLSALLAWLAAPGTAQAHERLTASEPAADAVLPVVPPRVLLTFSGDVLDPAPTLVLQDAAGAEVPTGGPVVEGATVALAVPGTLPNGAYTVQWRIVSADGDPVSGDYTFTVAAPETAAPPSSAPPSGSESSAAPSPAAASPAGAVTEEDSSAGPWLAGGAAAAALLAGVLVVRRTRTRG